jgi:hypothetical protein
MDFSPHHETAVELFLELLVEGWGSGVHLAEIGHSLSHIRQEEIRLLLPFREARFRDVKVVSHLVRILAPRGTAFSAAVASRR